MVISYCLPQLVGTAGRMQWRVPLSLRDIVGRACSAIMSGYLDVRETLRCLSGGRNLPSVVRRGMLGGRSGCKNDRSVDKKERSGNETT